MTTYQRETLFMVVDEAQDLLKLHYDELCLDKDKIALDPDWSRYNAMEQAGILQLFTARKEGRLIGYAVFFVQPHIHYQSLLVASNDILFIHPGERNSAGLRLIKFCEKELVKMKPINGEMKIVWRAKLGTVLHNLLPKMDYQSEEIAFAKLL